MRLRTLADLSDCLAQDLIWRKKELTSLRYAAERAVPESDNSKAFLRAWVALLYAHWEGYVKLAASAYVEYVYWQRLRNEELSIPFLALSTRQHLRAATTANVIGPHINLLRFVLDHRQARSNIPYKTAIHAGGNLNSARLEEILKSLGLDRTPFATKEHIIDEQLLARRNDIAHGEDMQIQLADGQSLHAIVLELLEEVRTQIENAAALQAYRAA